MTTTVYAVVCSNYYPAEIDSLWTTNELAQARADSMNGDWLVAKMPVFDKITDDDKGE